WRNTPHLSVRNSLRHTWPGLSWGVGAFIVYLGADAVISRMNNQSNVKPHSETKEES
ncbi:14817_t:CDS:1, partial [Funneliformis caledonium]